MANAHDVYKLIRSVALDVNGTVYTDDILLPALQAAARDLSLELTSRGYEKTEATVDLAIPQGATEISSTSTPALPTDFVAPQRLWEKITGGNAKFVPMAPRNEVPDVDQADMLRYWTWQGDKILFPGATSPVTVRLEYVKTILPITDSGSSIDKIVGARNYLAYAGLALVGLGRADADMIGMVEARKREALDLILDTYNMGDQYVYQRREYYGTGEHE